MVVSPGVRRLLLCTSFVAGFSACSAAPASAPAPPNRAPAQPARAAAPPADTVPVKLDTLANFRHEPTDSARNPFRFQPKVVTPPPKPVAAAPLPEVRPVPAAPPGPPPLPPIPLKFLGVVTRANGVKWAVLSDGKFQIYGRESDIIGGQYRIVSIGADSIELSYADGRGRQTVKLSQ
jgi:hypothetical protein